MSNDKFTKFLSEIGKKIPNAKVTEICLIADVPCCDQDTIKSFYDFILWAKGMELITENNLNYLEGIAKEINYGAVAKLIKEYQSEIDSSLKTLSDEQQTNVKHVFQDMCSKKITCTVSDLVGVPGMTEKMIDVLVSNFGQ